MRTREYRMPQKAQMFQCSRQLVSKEMCVAAVPECEKYVNTFKKQIKYVCDGTYLNNLSF